MKFSLASVLLSFTLAANANIRIFLEFDGIDGESRDNEFSNAIDVLSFSEGASIASSSQSGTTQSVPSFQNITVVKWLDSSSPRLRVKMAEGSLSPSATLYVRRDSGDRPFVFYEVELKNVFITSFSTSAAGGDDQLSEQITLGFEEIKWTYYKQALDGSPDGEVSEGWNIKLNKKL
jgi:type VI secretion system secreted protein Hcp